MKKIRNLNQKFGLLFSGLILIFSSCSEQKTEVKEETVAYASDQYEVEKVEIDPLQNKGVGPIQEIQLGAIDQELVAQGHEIFESKCSACHKFDKKYVGPSLGGVTDRRTPEWIMNMIVNPVEMTQKDPIAQELLATYLTQMTFQNVTHDEARSVLEYFRSIDNK